MTCRILLPILLAVLIGLAPIVTTTPALAQPAAADEGRAPTGAEVEELMKSRNSIAMFYYGSRYALHVIGGVVIGGYVFALLSWGRTGSTIFGSVIGSSIGIWWFLNDFAADVLSTHRW